MKTESKSITVKDFKEYIKDISDETRVDYGSFKI